MDELKKQLQEFNYYVDNYEEEIIKEQLDNQKTVSKINKKLDGLKKELRTALRNFNKEEIDYDEYTDLKKDINEEIDELKEQLAQFENNDENDTLGKYKKAIPKLQECLNEYDNMSIPQKNESLKSIVERVTYSKTKRLNWRKNEDDDMEIYIDMKL